MRNKPFIISFLILLSIALSSCAVNPVSGEKELMFVSEAQEVALGAKLYPNAIWAAEGGGGEFKDAELKTYLKNIIVKIHATSHRPNLPVDFAIQNSSVPNAWAIPGHVVITRGLLAGLRSEAEFAFVMGHEMGHVAARHSARRMTYGMLQQVGLAGVGLALGAGGMGDYSKAAMTVGAVGSSLVILKYSRKDELEADRLGMQYMSKLGYDTKNAISAHMNLERVANDYMASLENDNDNSKRSERGFFEELTSTHPRTSVRIAELQQMRAALPPSKLRSDPTGTTKYLAMTKDLRGKNSVYLKYYAPALRASKDEKYDEATTLLNEAIEKDKNEPPFHTLKGFIMIETEEYPLAMADFSTALNIDPDYEPALRGIGALHYMKGNYGLAVSKLTSAIEIYPQDLAGYYYLGLSHYMNDNFTKAKPYIEAYTSAMAKDPEIHTILGATYEHLGDIRSAYNQYAIQLKLAPYTDAGRFASERTYQLAPYVDSRYRGPRPRIRPKKYISKDKRS